MAEQKLKFTLQANTQGLKDVEQALSQMEASVVASNNKMATSLRKNANANRQQLVEPMKQAVTELRALSARLGEGFSELSAKLNFLNVGFNTLDGSVQKLAAPMGRLAQSSRAVGEGAKVAAASHDKLAVSMRNSNSQLTAGKQYARDYHDVMRGLTGGMGAIWLSWGQMGPLLAGFAVSAGVKQFLSIGIEFDKQVAMIGAASTDLRDKLGAVRQEILDLNKGSAKSVTDTAAIYQEIVKAGFSREQTKAATPIASDLSRVGDVEAGEAAKFVAAVSSAFEIKDFRKVADITVTAANESMTSIKEMMESIRQATTLNSMFGTSLEESSAAMMTLAKVGITGSAAGTAVTQMMTSLAGRSDQARKMISEVGKATGENISLFNKDGSLRSMGDVLDSLQKALARMTSEQRLFTLETITSQRGLKGLNGQLLEGGEGFRKYLASVTAAGKGGEALQGSIEQANKSISAQWGMLKSDLGNQMAQAFLGPDKALVDLIARMREVANGQGFKEFLSVSVDLLTGFGKALTAVVGNLDLLAAFFVGKGLVSAWGSFSKAAAEATANLRATTQAFNPLMLTAVPSMSKLGVAANSLKGILGGAFAAVGGWPTLVLGASIGVIGYFRSMSEEAEKLDKRIASLTANIQNMLGNSRYAQAVSTAKSTYESLSAKEKEEGFDARSGQIADRYVKTLALDPSSKELVLNLVQQGKGNSEILAGLNAAGKLLSAKTQNILRISPDINPAGTDFARTSGFYREKENARDLYVKAQEQSKKFQEPMALLTAQEDGGYVIEAPIADPVKGFTGKDKQGKTSGRFEALNPLDEQIKLEKASLELLKERSSLLDKMASLQDKQFSSAVLATREEALQNKLRENAADAELKLLEYRKQAVDLEGQLAKYTNQLKNDKKLSQEAKAQLQENIATLRQQIGDRRVGSNGYDAYKARVYQGRDLDAQQLVDETSEANQASRVKLMEHQVSLVGQLVSLREQEAQLQAEGLVGLDAQLLTQDKLARTYYLQQLTIQKANEELAKGGLSDERHLDLEKKVLDAQVKQLEIRKQQADLKLTDDKGISGAQFAYAFSKELTPLANLQVSLPTSVAQGITGGFKEGTKTFADYMWKGKPWEGFKEAAKSMENSLTNSLAQWTSDYLTKNITESIIKAFGLDLLNTTDMLLSQNTLALNNLSMALGAQSATSSGGVGGGLGGLFSGLFGGLFGNSSTDVNSLAYMDSVGVEVTPMVMATGGHVQGPGTATSDSIPAMLSNGEYVLKASAVSRLGVGFLDSLNSGRATRHYASGGLVTPASTQAQGGAASSPSTGVEVNIINQSGQPVQAEASQPRFNGEKMIVDVILKKLATDRNFRNAVRGA